MFALVVAPSLSIEYIHGTVQSNIAYTAIRIYPTNRITNITEAKKDVS